MLVKKEAGVPHRILWVSLEFSLRFLKSVVCVAVKKNIN